MPGANVPRSDRDLPVNIDRTKASVARVYDAALGGKLDFCTLLRAGGVTVAEGAGT